MSRLKEKKKTVKLRRDILWQYIYDNLETLQDVVKNETWRAVDHDDLVRKALSAILTEVEYRGLTGRHLAKFPEELKTAPEEPVEEEPIKKKKKKKGKSKKVLVDAEKKDGIDPLKPVDINVVFTQEELVVCKTGQQEFWDEVFKLRTTMQEAEKKSKKLKDKVREYYFIIIRTESPELNQFIFDFAKECYNKTMFTDPITFENSNISLLVLVTTKTEATKTYERFGRRLLKMLNEHDYLRAFCAMKDFKEFITLTGVSATASAIEPIINTPKIQG